MASPQPLKILYHLHQQMDTLDFAGPLEIFFHATHAPTSDNSTLPSKLFHATVTAVDEFTTTAQNCTIKRHIPISEAYSTLADYDVLLIPGGGSDEVLEGKTEPLDLIKAFVELPKRVDGRTRYLLSVCTGSLFLAEAGVLDGLSATTHVNFYGQLRKICERRGRTKVLEERFVVNKVDGEKGLRTVTSGGISSGLDACLWLVEEIAGKESRERVMHNVSTLGGKVSCCE